MSLIRHLALLALLLPLACDNKPAAKREPVAPADGGNGSGDGAAVNVPKDHYGTAAVRGRVRFEGKRPPMRPIQMGGDAFCHNNARATSAPKFQIAEDGGVPWVFVHVKKGIEGEYTTPATPVTLDQHGCMYEPHVFGIFVNQPLEILNSDDTAHNVNSLATRNERFNISQPQKGNKHTRTFTRPEIMVKFKCDVHGWMDAYAGVMRHPFFAVTDKEGNFEIARLPAGSYELEIWHELWGKRTQMVTLGEGETKEVAFTYEKDGE